MISRNAAPYVPFAPRTLGRDRAVGLKESQEYIATSKVGGGKRQDFHDLLAAVDDMPFTAVKKVSPRYVLFEANETDAATLQRKLGAKYEIAPNRELGLLG
jgi:hypothetical protein